ncbi:MAG: reverse transcriptase domain-containing protein, partial [Myxococcota bacterium]
MMHASDQVWSAYRKLKRFVYYTKNDLELRQRLATFERAADFESRLNAVRAVVDSPNPSDTSLFQQWLAEIRYRVVPKRFIDQRDTPAHATAGRLISNVTTAETYTVCKVNYFFEGPIELHLIAVVWIIREGVVLDHGLGKECYGSRLERAVKAPEDRSAALFKKYHEMYSGWRDSGINKAAELLVRDGESVCVLGLDIQEFYYHVRADFKGIADVVKRSRLPTSVAGQCGRAGNLTSCIQKIGQTFHGRIASHLAVTNSGLPPGEGLPIGLCSSPVIANWYLRDLDRAILKEVRPAYYGRYLDDIIIVTVSHDDPTKEQEPVETFADHLLVKPGVFPKGADGRYEVAALPGM